jgi:hypothetical protein
MSTKVYINDNLLSLQKHFFGMTALISFKDGNLLVFKAFPFKDDREIPLVAKVTSPIKVLDD